LRSADEAAASDSAAHFVIGSIHMLQKLPVVLKNACIFKRCAVLQSGNITAEQARAAAR
jgi:hypothetical protein